MNATPAPIVMLSLLAISCGLGRAPAGEDWASAGELKLQAATSATRADRSIAIPRLGVQHQHKRSSRAESSGFTVLTQGLVARACVRREILIVLSLFAFMFVGVGGAVLLACDVWPFGRK